MGNAPWWYRRMRAAKYLGVDPRTLDDLEWVLMAEAAMGAEIEAQEKRQPKGGRARR